MKQYQFHIKHMPAVEAGKYRVQTKGGIDAKVVDWTSDGKITVDIPGHRVEYHNPLGKWWDDRSDSELDLVLVKVENYDKTLDKKISNIVVEAVRTYCEKNNLEEPHCVGPLLGDELAMKYHKDIIRLAKEEVLCSDETLKEYAETAAKLAKEEILKGIPKWKIAERDYNSNELEFAVLYRVDGGDHPDWDEVVVTNRLQKGEKYLDICDLDKLPNENKES